MQAKTLQQWIEFYEAKTGDKVVTDDESRHLFYLPERGFCELSIDREHDRLWMHGVCGDGKFWHDFALMEADGQGLSSLCAITLRNINSVMKRFGGKDIHYNIVGQRCCHDKNGRLLTASKTKDGEWFLEKYVNKDKFYECEVDYNV